MKKVKKIISWFIICLLALPSVRTLSAKNTTINLDYISDKQFEGEEADVPLIPIIEENFEKMQEGVPPDSPWIPSSSENVLVASDVEQGKCLYIKDDSTSSKYDAKIRFSPVTDCLTVSFKFKVKFQSGSSSFVYFQLFDSGQECMRLRLYKTATTIRFENQASSTAANVVINGNVSEGVWHEVKYKLDIQNNQVLVFFDNDKIGVSAMPLYLSSFSQVSELRFSTHSSTHVELYVDDVKVYDQDVVSLPPFWVNSNIEVKNISYTSADLEWTPAWDFIGVEKYRIYSLFNNDKKLISEIAGATYTTLGELIPNNSYTIKVEAVDYLGNETTDGPIVTFSTLSSSDVNPPTWDESATVNIVSYDEKSVTISWAHATDESGVAKYFITINGDLVGEVAGDINNYTYQNLLPNTEYVIKVYAEDVLGNKTTDGLIVNFRTKEDNIKPYWQNSTIRYSIISRTSIKLEWDGAMDNMGVVGYIVYKDGTKVKETSINSCIIDELSLGKTYTFKVEAIDISENQSVDGPSIEVEFKDNEPPYWVSKKILISDLTPTFVRLKWNIANDIVGVVGYNVYLNGKLYNATLYNATHAVLGDICIGEIDNLEPGVVYEVEIEAVDEAGNRSEDKLEKIFMTPQSLTQQPYQESQLVYEGEDGYLKYRPYTEKGDIIPDFSQVGYKAGDEPIPSNVPVKEVVYPDEDMIDDTARIQQAINRVADLPLDDNGFRGAVLIKKGKYYLNDSLNITSSGIVIYGEGQDEEGTVLYATRKSKYDLIIIKGSGNITEVPETRVKIIDDYVPVGARSFNVENASKFKIGDSIIVVRKANDQWIHDIGMDRIPTDKNPTVVQWKASDYWLQFERKIVDIKGNQITIDVPITNSIDSYYGGGEIYKYTFEGRINNVGIENLRIVSYFDKSKYDSRINEYIDEDHGWKAISINYAEDCWVRNVTGQYFAYSTVSVGSYARRVTVDSCSNLDPVSTLSGGLRYSFEVNGQQVLVKNCYSRGGRHDFVLGSRTRGPNVFYNCLAENANSVSEPHHRWSAGVLYDNVTVKGKQGYLQVINRNDSGTGHGWAGAQVVFWNCSAPVIIAMKPPTAQNFVIGFKERISGDEAENALDYGLRQANSMARTNFIYEGIPVIGDAFIESPLAPVKIESLYMKQLEDRMKKKAAKDITAFSIISGTQSFEGIIEGNVITIYVPANVDLKRLVATFETTGVAVYVNNTLQVSGVTVNDFSKPVSYIVFAEDGSWKEYIVKVISNTWPGEDEPVDEEPGEDEPVDEEPGEDEPVDPQDKDDKIVKTGYWLDLKMLLFVGIMFILIDVGIILWNWKKKIIV